MTNTIGPVPKDVTVRYLIDNAASRFTVQAFAAGLLSAFGHNPVIAIPDFTGEIELSENLEKASVVITIPTASLKVVSDMSDKDRLEVERVMHEQVLQSERYPEIVYDCTRVSASKTGERQYWVALNGELTLRGITRGLSISARVSLNGEALKASGSFSLLQSDYEIALVSVAGGALKVKDELKFSFEIVARKQG
jgi:polyisoprenoid-binding protein YceI